MKILISAPKQLLLFACQIVIRRVNGEIEFVCIVHQLIAPPLHCLSLPASDRVLEDRSALIGHDQILVNADHLTVTLATGAGSDRVVETEKVLGWLFELHSVQFHTRRVFRDHVLLVTEHNDLAYSATQFVGSRHGISQTATQFLVV